MADPKKVDPKKPEIEVPSIMTIHDRQQRLIQYYIDSEKSHNKNIQTLFDNQNIQEKNDKDLYDAIVESLRNLDDYNAKLERQIYAQDQIITMILRMIPFR